MAFGTNPTDFITTPFDTGEVVGTGAQAKAKERAYSYLDTARVAGSGLDTIGNMKYNEIIGDAKRSAQSTANNASFISGGLDLLGSVGSFGAAGGFDPSKSFMNGGPFGTTPIGAGGGTLPKLGLFGKETVGTLGPNYGFPQ